jgi:hypothetical protein
MSSIGKLARLHDPHIWPASAIDFVVLLNEGLELVIIYFSDVEGERNYLEHIFVDEPVVFLKYVKHGLFVAQDPVEG